MLAASAAGVRQMFLHAPCKGPRDQHRALLQQFTSRFWPDVAKGLERLLVVVPAYGDFLKVRRFLKSEDAKFCSLHEYSAPRHMSVNRQRFRDGSVPLLLVTERFLWYRRYTLRGVGHLLTLGVPATASIYRDLVARLDGGSASAVTLFTPFDALALERIVGSDRAAALCRSAPKKLFVYT